MELSLDLHPEAEAAITALRMTLLNADGKTLTFDTNEDLAIAILNEQLVSVALQRHPPPDMAAKLKAAQEALNAVAKEELDKRMKAGVIDKKKPAEDPSLPVKPTAKTKK